ERNAMADFSSKGPSMGNEAIKPDLVAPGMYIESSELGWGTKVHNGTSMAAPHITGVAALLLEGHPDWTPEIVKGVLCGTAEDLGEDVYTQGSGRVNAWRAANTATTVIPNNLGLGITNQSQNVFQVERYITIYNLNEESMQYQLSLDHSLPAGVQVDLQPTTMSLNAGMSDSVLVTMTVDNYTIPLSDQLPGQLEGRIQVASEKDTLVVPFSLLHIPSLYLAFVGHPHFVLIVKKPNKIGDKFYLDFYLPDSAMKVLLPAADEYCIFTIFNNFIEKRVSYVLKNIQIDESDSLVISESDAYLKVGLEMPVHIAENLDVNYTQFFLRICYEGPHYMYRYTYNLHLFGYPNLLYICPITESENTELGWLSLLRESDTFYYASDDMHGISEDQYFTLQPDRMKMIDYSVNIAPLTSKRLTNLKIMPTRYHKEKGGSTTYRFSISDLFSPLEPDCYYRWYFYPQKKYPIYRLKIAVTGTDFFKKDDCWQFGYTAFHENEITVMEELPSSTIGHFPFTDSSGYFGIGISPPYPKESIKPLSNLIWIPSGKFNYQMGDYSTSYKTCHPNYQLFRDSSLISEGTAKRDSIDLPREKGTYRLVLTYPDVILMGKRSGDVEMTAVFDNSTPDSRPPGLYDLKILSNGNFIDPNKKAENVTVSANLFDTKGITDVLIQCRAAGISEWQDLTVFQDDRWYSAEIPDSLFQNWVDLNLVATDESGNSLSYTLLPAYINQAVTRVSDVRIIPDYVLPNQIITLQAQVEDDDGISAVMAEIESPDETVINTFLLFDDGNHNDSQTGDHLFANQWTVVIDPADFVVDLHTFDHFGNQEIHQNVIQFTTQDMPYLQLFEKEILRHPNNSVGKINIKNTGAKKASNILLHVEPDSEYYFMPLNSNLFYGSKFDKKIGDLAAGDSVKVLLPWRLGWNVPDSTMQFLFITMTSGEFQWCDTLRIFVTDAGPVFYSDYRIYPRNARPREQITVECVVEDPDGVHSVKAYFKNTESSSVVDSINLIHNHIEYQGQWKTPENPMDCDITLWAHDSLGNISTDSTLAFTTKPLPNGLKDVLVLGNY
ncbi:MAG: S8 family serine peptidase, partial [Thermoplasmata archaeon]